MNLKLSVQEFGETCNRILDAFERGERDVPTSTAVKLVGHIEAVLKEQSSLEEALKRAKADYDDVAQSLTVALNQAERQIDGLAAELAMCRKLRDKPEVRVLELESIIRRLLAFHNEYDFGYLITDKIADIQNNAKWDKRDELSEPHVAKFQQLYALIAEAEALTDSAQSRGQGG